MVNNNLCLSFCCLLGLASALFGRFNVWRTKILPHSRQPTPVNAELLMSAFPVIQSVIWSPTCNKHLVLSGTTCVYYRTDDVTQLAPRKPLLRTSVQWEDPVVQQAACSSQWVWNIHQVSWLYAWRFHCGLRQWAKRFSTQAIMMIVIVAAAVMFCLSQCW